MDKRGNLKGDKLASGLLRGAVVAGLAAGLAAASLGAVPTADATCIGISGINIGGECHSSFGNFAMVLGTGTATANGLFTAAIGIGAGRSAISGGLGTLAYAGHIGTLAETQGILNFAAAGFGFSGLGEAHEPVAGPVLIPLIFSTSPSTAAQPTTLPALVQRLARLRQVMVPSTWREIFWATPTPARALLNAAGKRLWERRRQCCRQPEPG